MSVRIGSLAFQTLAPANGKYSGEFAYEIMPQPSEIFQPPRRPFLLARSMLHRSRVERLTRGHFPQLISDLGLECGLITPDERDPSKGSGCYWLTDKPPAARCSVTYAPGILLEKGHPPAWTPQPR